MATLSEPASEENLDNITEFSNMSSIVFFVGILLAVAALEHANVLKLLAQWLDATVGRLDVIVILLGLLSAIIDNVPLVAATMTGRARAGIATMDSRLLFFGTAGLAAGELKDGPINKMKMGWTAGGGVEWAFLPKWSAKAEYLYTEFKHDNLPDLNAAKLHSFHIGVNYHFDLFR